MWKEFLLHNACGHEANKFAKIFFCDSSGGIMQAIINCLQEPELLP